MGLWSKSVLIFNAIREHGQQSVRRLAERTGLSKSSVHRHLQAIHRRDCYPESSLWETEVGRTWLIRLVVATLFVFGLKRGVGAETLSEFFGRLHLEAHAGCSPNALRSVIHTLERIILDTAAAWEQEGIAQMRQGIAAWRAGGAEQHLPYYLALLAEAYGKAGQAEEGLSVLAEGLTAVHKTGERQHEAELYRLKGELLLKQDVPDEQEAERCFRQAVDAAR
jgi:tetratricopeptide (TPR) repeat protein